jgi:hypothetical protein
MATHPPHRSSPLRETQSAVQAPPSQRLRRSGNFIGKQGPLHDIDTQQQDAGTVLGAEHWREAEALLAELPARLANVAIVLKAHVWPAMTAMPHASRQGLKVRKQQTSCFGSCI